MLKFTKMNGAGNDFVIIDNRSSSLDFDVPTIVKLCNRHRGIGADGFMSVEPAQADGDFRMRYYNADGNEAEMCGNGARCFARFVNRIAETNGKSINIETVAGTVGAQIKGDQVKIKLSDPFDLTMNIAIDIKGEPETIHYINTGVPHAVVISQDINSINIKETGSFIRYHKRFAPFGTNVNFQQVLESNRISIRTYERGVEDETLACGTGMVANALIHHQLNQITPPVLVDVRGGDTLRVGWETDGAQYFNVALTGPADFVFEGEIDV